jgi:AcrR family transcriptional regulator
MQQYDRRKERTRKWLQQALMALIQEVPYETITVQGIVERADTARITFYRHYRDKDELLMDCLETIYEELVQAVEPLKQGDFFAINKQPPIGIFYHHIEQNKPLYRAILTGPTAAKVQPRFQAHISGLIRQHIEQLLPPRLNPIPPDILANHMAAAYIGLIVWWLDNDVPYSAEYLALTAHWINILGLVGATGIAVDVHPPDLNWSKPDGS